MSDVNLSTVNETAAVEQPGFLKRILWALVSPGKLMECLAEKPRVLFGFLLSALSLDVLFLIRFPLYKEFLKSSMLASGQASAPELIDQMIPFAAIGGLIGILFVGIFLLLLVTVIFFAIFKLMGGQGRFKAYLSVACYSYVVKALYNLLLIPISFMTGSLYQNVSLTSVAALVSKDSVGAAVYTMLSGIDLFSIWYFVVMAIGFATVSKLKKKFVYPAVAVVFVLSIVLTAVYTGIVTAR